MTMSNTGRPSNGQATVTKTIPGQYIAKASVSYSARQRARDAVLWHAGEAKVQPTWKMAADVFGVSVARVAKARRRLEQQNRRRNGSPIPPPTDHEADRLVEWLGAERVMRALDRATQPPLPFTMAAE
jgi:hypothetical protein